MKQSYLTVEIPDDQLITAIAEEAAIRDADLDLLERRLGSRAIQPSEAAALALTIGRAGRAQSAQALRATRLRLEEQGHILEARAVQLALEILTLRPPKIVERAERGYRRRDEGHDEELFIEDPLAAHWHLQGRWGPPIRAHIDRPQYVAREAGAVDELTSMARQGEIVLVYFLPERITGSPHPPLRLMSAALCREPSLRTMIRWSQIRSVGAVEQRGMNRAAFEVRGEPVEILPAHPSIPVEDLIELMTRLLKMARS